MLTWQHALVYHGLEADWHATLVNDITIVCCTTVALFTRVDHAITTYLLTLLEAPPFVRVHDGPHCPPWAYRKHPVVSLVQVQRDLCRHYVVSCGTGLKVAFKHIISSLFTKTPVDNKKGTSYQKSTLLTSYKLQSSIPRLYFYRTVYISRYEHDIFQTLQFA